MLTTLALLLAFQSTRIITRPNNQPLTNTDVIMAPGVKDHFADGITVLGKIVFPSDAAPVMLDIDLEDQNGTVVDSTKLEPKNQFRFNKVSIVDVANSSFQTYYLVINSDGF